MLRNQDQVFRHHPFLQSLREKISHGGDGDSEPLFALLLSCVSVEGKTTGHEGKGVWFTPKYLDVFVVSLMKPKVTFCLNSDYNDHW